MWVLRQDYIRTAWSKGLRERAVVVRHAIKNALIPIVTLVGLQLPILVGGSVIMENIFNLPGLGRLMLAALTDRDYPMVSGVNLVFGTAVVGVNLMVDLLYGWHDLDTWIRGPVINERPHRGTGSRFFLRQAVAGEVTRHDQRDHHPGRDPGGYPGRCPGPVWTC